MIPPCSSVSSFPATPPPREPPSPSTRRLPGPGARRAGARQQMPRGKLPSAGVGAVVVVAAEEAPLVAYSCAASLPLLGQQHRRWCRGASSFLHLLLLLLLLLLLRPALRDFEHEARQRRRPRPRLPRRGSLAEARGCCRRRREGARESSSRGSECVSPSLSPATEKREGEPPQKKNQKLSGKKKDVSTSRDRPPTLFALSKKVGWGNFFRHAFSFSSLNVASISQFRFPLARSHR